VNLVITGLLRLLAAGRANRQIARELQISPARVEKHLQHIYRELGVSSGAQALAYVYAPTGCQAVLSSVTASSRFRASFTASS
jgi:predicted DNA-binding transcriptional regulator